MNRLLWPGLLFVLIGSIVAMNIVMLIVATGDASFAVDSAYNRGGDTSAAFRQAQENRRLGWAIEAEARRVVDTAMLEIAVMDGRQAPLVDAVVTVEVFHHARAAEKIQAEVLQQEPGRYTALFPATRTGKWGCTIEVTSGSDRFVEEVDIHLGGAQP